MPGSSAGGGLVHVRKSVAINAAPEELYGFWRQFGNLTRFTKHLVSVEDKGEGQSHWTARGPAGVTVEWDARIIADKPNEMIAWRSLPGAVVDHAGSVRFEPRPIGRGTVVRAELCYRVPAGALGATVAAMFGKEPGQQVQTGSAPVQAAHRDRRDPYHRRPARRTPQQHVVEV